MVDNIQSSHNSIQYQITQYKTNYSCDGRGCFNTATFEIKIWYLKPHALLCERCKEDLEQSGLIEFIVTSQLIKKPVKFNEV